MAEQLLNPMEVANRLRVKRTAFYELRPKLIALGLRTVRVGKTTKYLESSLDRVILKLVEQEYF